MKNIFSTMGILFLLLFLSSFIMAQRNISFADELPDTLSGAGTETYEPGIEIETKSGIVGFQVTYTGDTLKTVSLRGSFDGDEWATISTQDKDAGTYWLNEDTPEYWYYQLYCNTASIDTVVITDVRFIYKED